MLTKMLPLSNRRLRYLKFVPTKAQENFVNSKIEEILGHFPLSARASFSLLKTGDFYMGVLEVFEDKNYYNAVQVESNIRDLLSQLKVELNEQVSARKKSDYPNLLRLDGKSYESSCF